jgi:hypothetical protein
MASPKSVWHAGRGTLSSEASGFRLSIKRSATPGCFEFTIVTDPGDAVPPCTVAFGSRRSALLAMAAAEQALVALGRRLATHIPLASSLQLPVVVGTPAAATTGRSQGTRWMTLLLIIIILLLLFGGGGYYGRRAGWYGGYGDRSNIGLGTFLVIILIVILLLGGLGGPYLGYWHYW